MRQSNLRRSYRQLQHDEHKNQIKITKKVPTGHYSIRAEAIVSACFIIQSCLILNFIPNTHLIMLCHVMIEIMTLISLESKIFYKLTMNGYTISICMAECVKLSWTMYKKLFYVTPSIQVLTILFVLNAITSILLIISVIQDSALPVVLSIKKFLPPKLRLCVLMFITVILFLQQQRTGCT